MKKVTDFINGKVTYDNEGQYFWINSGHDGMQMLGELRGWGAIQHLFPLNEQGQKDAGKFQDEIGEFVAEAINEKIQRIKDAIKSVEV